jgi:hypothetical protein
MTFTVDFGGAISLSVDEIWPDGDAPENPTANDVIQRMCEYGPKMQTLQDWRLEPVVTLDGELVWS